MNSKKVPKGFTLLEVLVALSIMAISLIGVMKSVLMVQDALYDSSSRSLAAELAHTQLARVKQTGLENMFQFSGAFENHPGYRWQLEKISLEEDELFLIRLEVFLADSSKRVLGLEELFWQAGP